MTGRFYQSCVNSTASAVLIAILGSGSVQAAVGEPVGLLGYDTGLVDRELGTGLLSDALDEAVDQCKSAHGEVIGRVAHCVSRYINGLKRKREINGREMGALKSTLGQYRDNRAEGDFGNENDEGEGTFELTLSIIDTAYQPIDAAPISVNGEFVMFSSNGSATLELTGGDYTIGIGGADYAGMVLPLSLPEAGQAQREVVLVERQSSTLNRYNSVTVANSADGSSITFPNGAFGAVEPARVYVTPVDVSDSLELQAFPGEFSGILEDSTETPIASLGVVEFHIEDADGNELQLQDGQNARILIPIYFDTYPTGEPVEVDDSIPLWSLDESAGLWVQEGEGLVMTSGNSPTGLAMLATVSHFSWWNCDVALLTGQVQVQVEGPEGGTAVITATTDADIGFRPDTVSAVVATNILSEPLFVPANELVCFGASVTTAEGASATEPASICTSVGAGAIEQINLNVGELLFDIFASATELSVLEGRDLPDPITIYARSFETAVTYQATGLPAGLTLQASSATTARIVGAPTTAGTFNVEINATTADGETAQGTLQINVESTSELDMLFNVSALRLYSGFEIDDDQNYRIEVDLLDFVTVNNGTSAPVFTLFTPDPADSWYPAEYRVYVAGSTLSYQAGSSMGGNIWIRLSDESGQVQDEVPLYYDFRGTYAPYENYDGQIVILQ